jgi:hypothetical protein
MPVHDPQAANGRAAMNKTGLGYAHKRSPHPKCDSIAETLNGEPSRPTT